MVQTSCSVTWNEEVLVSTCAIASRRIGRSSCWKLKTRVGAFQNIWKMAGIKNLAAKILQDRDFHPMGPI